MYISVCVLPSETRITREHDAAMNKLFDWLARFEMQLNETLASVKEFYTKDRMSEAKTYLAQLEELRDRVQGFLEEVYWIQRNGHDKFRYLLFCSNYWHYVLETNTLGYVTLVKKRLLVTALAAAATTTTKNYYNYNNRNQQQTFQSHLQRHENKHEKLSFYNNNNNDR